MLILTVRVKHISQNDIVNSVKDTILTDEKLKVFHGCKYAGYTYEHHPDGVRVKVYFDGLS